jgi:hypothetical protein
MTMRDSGVGFLRRRPWAVAVAIVMAVPLAAGVVAAGIPEPDGSLHACVNLYNGGVRMIDPTATPGQTCNGDEKQVNWSAGTFLVDAAPPTGNDGHNGDMWFDKTNKVLYGPKTAGTWGAGTSLKGDPGTPGGLSGWERVQSNQLTVAAGAYTNALVVQCTGARKVLGGGVFSVGVLATNPVDHKIVVEASAPNFDGDGWFGAVRNDDTIPHDVYIWAICADAV